MEQSPVELSTEGSLETAKASAVRVLHVDDDAGFLKTAKTILEMQGAFQVETASSAEEAVGKMKTEKYDVVVCDYQMPRKDGLQFLKELRARGNSIPFIVFTGKGREEIAIKALNLGADGYFNKSGEPETVYGELAHGMRQVVGKRRAEQSFLKSEDKYRRLVETLREGIWVIDKDSCTTFVNPRMAEILGYDIEEMKGRHLFSFMDERYVEIAKRLLERRRQGIKEQHNFEFLRKDGTRVYVTLETAPITDDNGKYVGALASVMDITERKKAEEELLASEAKWRSIAENSPDHIILLDKDGKILYINHTVPDLTTEKVLGKSKYDFVPSEFRKVAADCNENVLETGKPSSYVTEYRTKEGEIRYFDVRVVPILQSGKVVGLISNSTDITERKKMEEEIKSLARFPSENPNPVLRISQDSRMLFANDAGKVLLKKLNSEVGGSVPTFLKNLTVKTLKSKSRGSEESEIEGHVYGFYATPIVDKGYVNVYVIDITERRKAQGILKESEAKYRTLVEQSVQGIVIAQGVPPRLVFANPAMVRISGYTSEELASVPMERLIHPDDRAAFFSRLKERFEGKPTSSPNEYRAIRKDGKTAWIAISASRIEYGGQPAVQAVFVDITESKNTEQAIIENKQKFESLFKGNPEAAAYLGPDFCILDVNPRFEKLFGYSLAEVKGKNIDDVVVQGDKIEEAELLNERAKEAYVYHNTLRRRKDGSLVPVSVSAAPVAIEGGLAGIVAMYKDISELKDAEKKLEMMNEKLRVVGGFTRHDVRNKLSSVINNVYLAKQSLPEGPKALAYLRDIELACGQTTRILDFAAAYESLGVEELVVMDVGKAVEEAVLLTPNLKGIKVMNECHGFTVIADSLLRQLFYNLIDNSLKHGEKVSQIRFHHEGGKDGLELFYEDDGVGIPKPLKSKILDSAFTASKGSGYGLPLIKRMIEVYCWQIEEKGEPGKGAKFVITIPIRTDSNQKQRHSNKKAFY